MAAYFIFDVTETDPAWREGYLEPTRRLIAKHGGKFLARTSDHTKVEGDAPLPGTTVVLEFPSIEAARAWHTDPEYLPLIEQRRSGTITEGRLVPGME